MGVYLILLDIFKLITIITNNQNEHKFNGILLYILILIYRTFSIIGLILIVIGMGGVKPCVSAFGGDQFILPQQQKQLSQFFAIFYFR